MGRTKNPHRGKHWVISDSPIATPELRMKRRMNANVSQLTVAKEHGRRLGKPRKVQRVNADASADFESMIREEQLKSGSSQSAATRYDQRKIEAEIAKRVNEGEDRANAEADVLADYAPEVHAARLSPDDFKEVMFPKKPHTFKRPAAVRKAKRKNVDQPYLPSTAAHTYPISPIAKPIPTLRLKPPVGRKSRKSKSVLGYFPSTAAHTISMRRRTAVELGIQFKATSGKSTNASQYLPSVFAHTTPLLRQINFVSQYVTSVSAKKSAPVRKPLKRKRKNLKTVRPYYPSIAAHTQPPLRKLTRSLTFGTTLSTRSSSVVQVAGKKPDRAIQPIYKYLPSVLAHTQLPPKLLVPIIQDPKPSTVAHGSRSRQKVTKAVQTDNNQGKYTQASSKRSLEGARKKMTYEEQSQAIKRLTVGVYVGELADRKIGQGRPRRSRLIIFKSGRFGELNLVSTEYTTKASIGMVEDKPTVFPKPIIAQDQTGSHLISKTLPRSQSQRPSSIVPHSPTIKTPTYATESAAGSKRKRTSSNDVSSEKLGPAMGLFAKKRFTDSVAKLTRSQVGASILAGMGRDGLPVNRPSEVVRSFSQKNRKSTASTVMSDALTKHDSALESTITNEPLAISSLQVSTSSAAPYVTPEQQKHGHEEQNHDLSMLTSTRTLSHDDQGYTELENIIEAGKDHIGLGGKSQLGMDRLAQLQEIGENDDLRFPESAMLLPDAADYVGPLTRNGIPVTRATPTTDSVSPQTSSEQQAMDISLHQLNQISDHPGIVKLGLAGVDRAVDTSASLGRLQKAQQKFLKNIQIGAENLSEIHVENSKEEDGEPVDGSVSGSRVITKIKPFGGSIGILRRKIMLEIVENCEGVFPGDKEIWYPFTTLWLRRGDTGKPDMRTLKQTQKALVDAGRLRQLRFAFENKQGIAITKTIITLAGVSPTDQKVKDLQRMIIDHYPHPYIPEQAEVSEELRSSHGPTGHQFAESSKDIDVDISSQPELRYVPPYARRSLKNKKAAEELNLGTPKRHSGRPPGPVKNTVKPGSKARKPARSRVSIKGPAPFDFLSLSENQQFEVLRDIRLLQGLSDGEAVFSSTQGLRPLLDFAKPSLAGMVELAISASCPPRNDPCALRRDSHLRNPARSIAGRVRFVEILGIDSNFNRSLSPEPELGEQSWLLDQTLEDLRETCYESRMLDDSSRISKLHTPSRGRKRRKLSNSNERDTGRSSCFRESTTLTEGVSMYGVNAEPPLLFYSDFMAPWKSPELQAGTFINFGPATFDPDYESQEFTTLSDPDQKFYPATGTFSTEFLVLRNARLDLWRNDWPMELDLALPHSLNDLLARCRRRESPERVPKVLTPEATFDDEIRSVLNWELITDVFNAVVSDDLRFINHSFSGLFQVSKDFNNRLTFLPPNSLATYNASLPRRRRTRRNVSEVTPRKRKLPGEERKLGRLFALLDRRPASSVVQRDDTNPHDADGRPSKKLRLRGKIKSKYLSEDGDRRLMIGVIMIRTLTGGIERQINWSLVTSSFKAEVPQNWVHRRWTWLCQKDGFRVDKLQADFQETFMKAYRDGVIPSLNYEGLEEYDWPWLIDWTLKNMDIPSRNTLPILPSSRSRLSDLFEMQETDEIDFSDLYEMNGVVSIPKRTSIANRAPYVMPIDRKAASCFAIGANKLEIAKTWIRANVITPEESYNPIKASAKLQLIEEDTIEEALQILLSTRVLLHENKGRLVPGRNYDVSKEFVNHLRKNMEVSHLKNAVAYKAQLDIDFAENIEHNFSWNANSGSVLAVINLLAHNRIRCRPKNAPANKFGLTEGNYKTRLIDKARLHFDIAVYPTKSYIAGNPLLPLYPPPKPDVENHFAKLPLWYDIHGEFRPLLWETALVGVMTSLVVRPGVCAAEIGKGMKPSLEEWEITSIMKWIVGVKAGKWVSEGESRGVVVEEWWWMCLPGCEKETENKDEGDRESDLMM